MKTIRANILALVASSLLALVAMAAAIAVGLARVDASVERVKLGKDMVADILPPPLFLVEMRMVLGMVADGTMPVAEAKKEYARLAKEYGDRNDFWRNHVTPGLTEGLMAQHHTHAQKLIESGAELIARAERGDRAGVGAALAAAHSHYLAHKQAVDANVTVGNDYASAALSDQEAISRFMPKLTLGLLGAASAAVALIAFVATRRIRRAVGGESHEIVALAERVTAGDLDASYLGQRPAGSALAAMASMCTSLDAIVRSVRGNGVAIAQQATQLQALGADLNRHAGVQADNVEQGAATVEEFSSAIRITSDAAGDVRTLAANARQEAENSVAVISSMHATVGQASEGARGIREFTASIAAIAMQTRILALNAAVEAARAGEQGRGFAVVAQEVKNLAQSADQAATQINTLVAESADSMDKACRLADDCTAAITGMAELVTQVSNRIDEISVASSEQAQGVTIVANVVHSLQGAVQDHTAMAERSSSATVDLTTRARALLDVVGHFRQSATVSTTDDEPGGVDGSMTPQLAAAG